VNRIDLILAIVLIVFALRGFWRGFSREFFGFIGLIGGVAVAAATYVTRHVPAITWCRASRWCSARRVLWSSCR
jgi:uncharacterized membrane protein required for colicin V production